MTCVLSYYGQLILTLGPVLENHMTVSHVLFVAFWESALVTGRDAAGPPVTRSTGSVHRFVKELRSHLL